MSNTPNNTGELTKKLKRTILLLGSLLLLAIAFSVYLIIQDNVIVGGVPFANPGKDPNAKNEVKEFRSRPYIGTKFHVHGVYYDVDSVTYFFENFDKCIDSTIIVDNKSIRKIKDTTLLLYIGKTTPFVSYGRSDTLFKGDTLKVVAGFYWKRKDDLDNGSKPQFDFCIVPTLRINREKNPRNGVIDFFDESSPLYNLYYHDDDDPNKFYSGNKGASDNGTMFP